MPLVINTNVQSLNSQRQLVKSGAEMSKAMERLSSGLRINKAADDAAGSAIANRMTSQVRGLNQAVRNANDGISMIQTADGALQESSNILQRMRELSIQASNGVYSDADRSTLNAEVKQLISELDRIADTTSFNGQNILDGKLGDVLLQVGSEANQTIGLNLGDGYRADDLGLGQGADIVGDVSNDGTNTLFTNLQANVGGAANTSGMYINGQDAGDLTALATTDSLQDALDLMNSKIGGVTVGALVNFEADGSGDGIFQGDEGLVIAVADIGTDNTQVATNVEYFVIQNTSSMEDLVSKINAAAGGALNASITNDGKLNITSTSAAQIRLTASLDVSGGPSGAAGDASLGVDALGIETADAGAITQEAQLTFTAESGTNGITVTYDDDISVANLTGVNERQEVGTMNGNAALTPADVAFGDVILNGVTLSEYDNAVDYDGNTTAGENSDFVAWINSHKAETGVVASVGASRDATITAALVLTSLDGSEISLEYLDENAAATETAFGMSESNNAQSFGGDVASIDISTREGAQRAINIVDAALTQINDARGDLGAANNRLDFTVSNLMNVSENTSAARSRIQDADFAAETAALSRAQVLQQASTAMLAQANAAPQQVLSLLQ